VDDLADASFFLLQNYDEELFVNIGTGEDLTIKELASMIKDIVGYSGELKWNTEKPDGTPRKLMDVSRLHDMGWKHRIGLHEGITNVYAEFVKSGSARA
jgi:GDP-L-fucose synthase